MKSSRAVRRVAPALSTVVLLFLVCQIVAQDAGHKTPNATATPAVTQPIPFSHKQHLGFDIKCAECHPNPEPGDRMTLPPTEKCMQCHGTIGKDKPAIQKLAEFARTKLEFLRGFLKILCRRDGRRCYHLGFDLANSA